MFDVVVKVMQRVETHKSGRLGLRMGMWKLVAWGWHRWVDVGESVDWHWRNPSWVVVGVLEVLSTAFGEMRHCGQRKSKSGWAPREVGTHRYGCKAVGTAAVDALEFQTEESMPQAHPLEATEYIGQNGHSQMEWRAVAQLGAHTDFQHFGRCSYHCPNW